MISLGGLTFNLKKNSVKSCILSINRPLVCQLVCYRFELRKPRASLHKSRRRTSSPGTRSSGGSRTPLQIACPRPQSRQSLPNMLVEENRFGASHFLLLFGFIWIQWGSEYLKHLKTEHFGVQSIITIIININLIIQLPRWIILIVIFEAIWV